jgi:hypothetical protein
VCQSPGADALKLNKLLKSIAGSLTFLSLSHCFIDNLVPIVNKMPKMKIFVFFEFSGDISNLKLKPNKNITVLHFNQLLKTDLLSTLISVQVLTNIRYIDEIFSYEWITKNMMNLQFARLYI